MPFWMTLVTGATFEVQVETLPHIVTKGVVLHSLLEVPDNGLNASGLQPGLNTKAAQNLPLPVSGD